MPMPDMTNAFDANIYAQFGIAGLILFVFFVMILMLLKIHANTIRGVVNRLSEDNRTASEAWRETVEKIEKRNDIRAAETNNVLRELSNTMHSGQFCNAQKVQANGK